MHVCISINYILTVLIASYTIAIELSKELLICLSIISDIAVEQGIITISNNIWVYTLHNDLNE